jgi:hypothetical protein
VSGRIDGIRLRLNRALFACHVFPLSPDFIA